MRHNFDGNVDTYATDESTIQIPIAYLALSTNDELQSVMEKSEVCSQSLQVSSEDCREGIMWTSLNGDEWTIMDICSEWAYLTVYSYMVVKEL